MLLQEALEFAIEAHKGQVRKFEGTAYIRHPMSVMGAMTEFSTDQAVLAACLLHDVVEDCEDIDLEVIHERFGEIVAGYVFYATEKSKKTDGPRAFRKEIDRRHYSSGSAESQNIKVIDMIDNLPTIVLFAKADFAEMYLSEKLQLLSVLKKCDPILKVRALELISRLMLLLNDKKLQMTQ